MVDPHYLIIHGAAMYPSTYPSNEPRRNRRLQELFINLKQEKLRLVHVHMIINAFGAGYKSGLGKVTLHGCEVQGINVPHT